MHQVAASLGIEVEVVKAAKKAGCTAFRANNSIDRAELKAWLADTKNQEKLSASVSYKDKKTFEEWRRLKLRNDREEGKVIDRIAIIAAINALSAACRETLEQKLLREYPAAVAGMDVPQVRVFSQRLIVGIYKEFQNFGGLWPP